MMPSDGTLSGPAAGSARYRRPPLQGRPCNRAEEPAMSVIPVMLIVWAVIAACFLALLAYRGQLTRYEEDQLFLNETESNEQREQSEIVRKVNRIEPFVRILGVATAAVTAGIVGIFTYDAWQHLK